MKLRKILLSVFLLAVSFLSAAAEKVQLKPYPQTRDVPPLVDFTEWKQNGSAFTDKCGNGVLTGGSTMTVCEGPFGGKAFCFDGLKTSVATLDLSKIKNKLDGFNYSISFWFKNEYQETRNQPLLSGNCPGLGLKWVGDESAHFELNSVGPGGINRWFDTIQGDWNHIAFVFSLHGKIMQLYVNGFAVYDQRNWGVFFPLTENKTGKFSVGAFKGAIADLKIWGAAVPSEQFKTMTLSRAQIEKLRGFLTQIGKKGEGFAGTEMMLKFLTKEVEDIIAKKTIPIDDYNILTKRLKNGLQLAPLVGKMKNTTLKDAPFLFFQARTISPEIRIPIRFPSQPQFTDVLKGISAGDEYSSATFFIYPFRDLKSLEFELPDLKNEKGNILPVSEMEMFFVQCWYQPGWNSYFNGSGNYVPGLLLRDPTLLKIDERNKRNFLRINYGGKPDYYNVTHGGSVFTGPTFQWQDEPIWDADKLMPCPCEFGRNRQFWIDFHVPKGTPSGIYRGKVKVKEEGKEVGYFTLALTVLPFDLPLPKTQFDHGRPFLQSLMGTDVGEEHMLNAKKHAILYQAIGFDYDKQKMKKKIDYMRSIGLPVKWIDAGIAMTSVRGEGAPPVHEWGTPENIKMDLDNISKQAQYMNKVLKFCGVNESGIVYWGGIDEAQDAGTLRSMTPYRNRVFHEGHRTATTGWEDNFYNMPAYETYHTTAAFVDRKNAERWHAIGCFITAYAAPFIGPDNPDLMRRSHGLQMYRSNYDGWWNLAYGYGGYHPWNNLYGYDTTYRQFSFIVSTAKGPIINKVAFCGMRDGQNDVRYATLMYQLADECFASGKPENILAARKAVAWFRGLPFPDSGDLDKARAGLTWHILAMMKQLGKKMN